MAGNHATLAGFYRSNGRLQVDKTHPTADASNIAIGQLNSTLGAAFDGPKLFQERMTAWATIVAVVAGASLGFLAVRLRRLELASARHAGVSTRAEVTQIGIETIFWAATAILVSLAGLLLVDRATQIPNSVDVDAISARSIFAGGVAAVIGSVVGAWTTRERHLFRYFKDR